MLSEEELREQLREQADEISAAIIARLKPAGENSLQEIEGAALGAGQQFRERVLAYLAQEESQAPEAPVCADCGRRLRSRGRRKRQIVSEAGEMEVERRYYVCPQCGKRSFPPR